MRRVALCALTAVAVAGTSTAVVQGKTSLRLRADPNGAPKFDKERLRAKPGKVTIRLTNPSPSRHAVEIEGKGVEKSSRVVGRGGKATVSATLRRGTYDFYCPVGNHRAGGMEGKLVVR